MKVPLLLVLILFTTVLYAQRTDTIQIWGDSVYWKITNPVRNKFWGNSTCLSQGVNFARNKEFELGLGRTRGLTVNFTGGALVMVMRSWGVNYALTDAPSHVRHSIKGFWEFGCIPPFFIGDFLIRGEYIYQMSDGQHYVRPSAGLTFVFFDISYNYSFLLNQPKRENLYRHGVSIRLKQFIKMKNWERKQKVDLRYRRAYNI